ncbi:hypothetical protein SAMN05216236_12353 [Sedimentitalea nanhaiensis]|uniref:Uncharacterized protein n=1 Tax=Sedimentitalea nanhaiensis TaxID=999627 RepID=A0A1I7D6Q5_9RHOB|nr:hypothetical protein [Sedimentitalea nanhaiensis]SFU07285.1 hypothetical protein SAMN05216236_12353 [Sedimentitalea nanhaiensis]
MKGFDAIAIWALVQAHQHNGFITVAQFQAGADFMDRPIARLQKG